jgi:hypothetical protein
MIFNFYVINNTGTAFRFKTSKSHKEEEIINIKEVTKKRRKETKNKLSANVKEKKEQKAGKIKEELKNKQQRR